MRVNFYDVANRYQSDWHREQVEFDDNDAEGIQRYAHDFRDSRKRDFEVGRIPNDPVIWAYEVGDPKEIIASA